MQECEGFKFTYHYEAGGPIVSVTLHKDATVTEVVAAFETFLKAAGYNMDNTALVLEVEE